MTKPIRPIRIEGNIAYVPLSKGLEAVIDASEVPIVEGFRWHAAASKCKSTGRLLTHYAHSSSTGKTVLMHRLLTGAGKGEQVDHIDSNGLNNTRSNMRVVTVRENQWNQRLSRANTSGYKGVTFNKKQGKWRAKIGFCGKRIIIGDFRQPEEAAAAYAKAAKELFGEYARLR